MQRARIKKRVTILIVCEQWGGHSAYLSLIFNTSCKESTWNESKGTTTFWKVIKKNTFKSLSKWPWFLWQSALKKDFPFNSSINYPAKKKRVHWRYMHNKTQRKIKTMCLIGPVEGKKHHHKQVTWHPSHSKLGMS